MFSSGTKILNRFKDMKNKRSVIFVLLYLVTSFWRSEIWRAARRIRRVLTLGACAITFATPCHWMVDKFTVTLSWSEQNHIAIAYLTKCGKSTYAKQSKRFISDFFQNNRMGRDWIYCHFANYILQVASWENWVKWKIVSIKGFNWFTLVALTQVMPWLIFLHSV